MEDISLFAFSYRQLYSYDMNKLIELRRAKMLALLYCLSPLLPLSLRCFCRPILGERREGDC